MNDNEAATIRAALGKAVHELNELCNRKPFRMSIPVKDTDSDQVIGEALHRVGELLAERERMRAVLDWYADIDNYDTKPKYNTDGMEWCEGAILSDLGTRACIVLGKPRKGDVAEGTP